MFALIGDMLKHFSQETLKPFLAPLMSILTENLEYLDPKYDPDQKYLSVCNNSCWCIGEFVMKFNEQTAPYLARVREKLVAILQFEKLSKALAQNVSLTLGRVGLWQPQETAEVLEKIIKPWCLSLRYIKDSTEK